MQNQSLLRHYLFVAPVLLYVLHSDTQTTALSQDMPVSSLYLSANILTTMGPFQRHSRMIGMA